MATPQFTHQDAIRLFDYNSLTGVLSWKPREYLSEKTPVEKMWDKRFSGKPVGAPHNGYIRFGIGSRLYLAHRVIWLMQYGEWPDVIDHVDGDRSNNKIENLRSVTRPENSLNRRLPKSNRSGVIGVHWCTRSGKWAAAIKKNGHTKHVGYFDDINDAKEARLAAQALSGFHKNHGNINGHPAKAQ